MSGKWPENVRLMCDNPIFLIFTCSLLQCLSLVLWLEERYETVYTRHPGFQKGSKPLLALDNPFPMELPESLYGEKWAFVQLPFSGTYLCGSKMAQDIRFVTRIIVECSRGSLLFSLHVQSLNSRLNTTSCWLLSSPQLPCLF